jgi:alpha-amylase
MLTTITNQGKEIESQADEIKRLRAKLAKYEESAAEKKPAAKKPAAKKPAAKKAPAKKEAPAEKA